MMAATHCEPRDTRLDEDGSLAQPTSGTTNIPKSTLPNTASCIPTIPLSKLFSLIQSSKIDAAVVPLKTPVSGDITEKSSPVASNDCSFNASPAETSEALPASQEASAQPSNENFKLVQIHSSAWPVQISDTEFENACPASITYEGVTVSLKNSNVWKEFYKCGTEMIVSRPGRYIFPNCCYRLSGLDPDRQYSMALSLVPTVPQRYRCVASKWDINGLADDVTPGVSRAIVHRNSPCSGRRWMQSKLEFQKLKLTNDLQNKEGYIIIQSMHRYIPRLHIIPVPNGVEATPSQPVVMGSPSITFTFPQTEFMAVTCYQNVKVIQLKVDHNPLARSCKKSSKRSSMFVEDDDEDNDETASTNGKEDSPEEVNQLGNMEEASVHVEEYEGDSLAESPSKDSTEAASPKCTEESIPSEEQQIVKKSPSSASPSLTPGPVLKYSNLVLRPISFSLRRGNQNSLPYVREGLELGDLSVVEDDDPSVDDTGACLTSTYNSGQTSSESSPESPGNRKRKRKTSNRAKCRAGTASPTVRSTAAPHATQPEMDDVEGQLFVSFTSKEHLDFHRKVDGAKSPTLESSPVPKSSTPADTPTEVLETREDRMARLEESLRMDLGTREQRQIIHPQLREVGLKLGGLEPTVSVDLQHLGVELPPISLPHSPTEALPSAGTESNYVSRTGKTSDVTKIKGWKNKFVQSEESASQSTGSEKNLSAFCSNMLDKYLESEALQISERAAAFSTCPEGSVAYQLPAQSSSYVKTLDSALRHRNAATLASQSPLATPEQPLDQSTPTQSVAKKGLAAPKAKKIKSTFKSPFGVKNRGPFLSKLHHKLMKGISNGLEHTDMTAERLSFALSALVTQKALSSKMNLEPQEENCKEDEDGCGRASCRLGCVCCSIHVWNKGPDHCQLPSCMFGCNCFKNKISQQSTEKSAEHSPFQETPNVDHDYQARRVRHMNRLWTKTIFDDDPEPLLTPAAPPPPIVPQCVIETVVEEEKDPVYKYLESLLTCARVRPVNCPHIRPAQLCANILAPTELKPKVKSEIKEERVQTKDQTSLLTVKLSGDSRSSEMQASKQIEIESACNWKKDQKMVLEGIFRQMERKSLSEQFCVGHYCINPVTRIFMKKLSGSFLTYRIRISSQSQTVCPKVDVEEDLDVEKIEDDTPPKRFGVVPFLMGVNPAGLLTANKVAPGGPTTGRIQVNGKCYNHTKLLLGNMGALHPANRLAAYITGRVTRTGIAKPAASSTNATTPAALVTAQNKTDATSTLKAATSTATSALASLTAMAKNVTAESGQGSGSKSSPALLQFVSEQRSVRHKTSLVTSPVSLTVSSSLKQPSFLEKSGTATFRIYPPKANGAHDQTQTGLSLPGGFTLCKLSKPGAAKSGANPRSAENTPARIQSLADHSETEKAPLPNAANVPLCKSEEVRKATVFSNQEHGSAKILPHQDLTSDEDIADTSDSEDDVDIMTVQEELGKCVEELREKVKCDHREKSVEPPSSQNRPREEWTGSAKRVNHIETERQRRSEQRQLFTKLQTVLKSDVKASRLHILEMTLKEIKNLQKSEDRLVSTKEMLQLQQKELLSKLEAFTGTSTKVIKEKLSDVCEKQKLREKITKWRPVFSNFLQTNAALLQVTTPQSKVAITPLLAPDTALGPFQSTKDPTETQSSRSETATQNQTVLPVAQERPELTDNKESDGIIATENRSEETETNAEPMPLLVPMDPEQARAHWNRLTSVDQKSTDEDVIYVKEEPAETEVKSAKDSSQMLGQLQDPARLNAVSLRLPLVRAKNCRLILPSYLKPAAPDAPKPSIRPAVPETSVLSGHNPTRVTNPPSNSPATAAKKRGRPRKQGKVVDKVFRPSSCVHTSSEVKRQRGRPPLKSKPEKADVNFDRMFRIFPASDNSPSSRPQTRASLGKNFPSEKRRSWKDLEMDLDLESEVDIEGL